MEREKVQEFGTPGYDQNGLEHPARDFRFCMCCGELLPQHYLDAAAGPQKYYVVAGYPICDAPAGQRIDYEFGAQIRARGVMDKFPIARRWHAYNPITGAQIIYEI
jgi:hypothetical protein